MNHNLVKLIEHLFLSMGVSVTKNNLKRRILSHPDYPSLQAITGVLDEYKIKNIAFRASIEQLNNMQHPVLIYLKERNGSFGLLHSIDKYKAVITTETNKKEEYPIHKFEQLWSGIALLAEPDKSSGEPRQTTVENKRLILYSSLMKSALAIVIFAITGLSLYAQKSTIIKCNVTSDIPVKLVIQEPFDIFFGYLSYIDTCQTKSPSNSFTFSRSFDIKQATYYRLMLLDSLNTFVSLTELIAIPQEQINIYLTTKDAMINTKFEGPNSEGHSLFNFTRQDRISFYKPLNSYISTINPTSNIAADVDSLAKQYIQPYDSLFAKNTISNEYLIGISANFRLTSSNFIVSELYSVSNVAKLNTQERVVMQNTLFQAIPANNPVQFSLADGTNYLAAYALYMQNQIENSNNIDTTINVNNKSLLIKYRFKPFLKLNNQFWQHPTKNTIP